MTLSATVLAWKNRQPNGRIPFSELQAIPNTWDVDLRTLCHFMPEAARSFEQMRRDMFEDIGILLRPSRSYRTLPDQQAKWDAYVARGKTPPVVAWPGTSNHGEALAGDMGFATFTDPRYLWLKRHGAAYGWHQNDAPSEPWHWDYEGDYDRNRFNFQEEEMCAKCDSLIDGLDRFLAGKPSPEPGPGARLYRALTRGVELPVAGAPGPHTHEHDHRVELKGRSGPAEVIA